jgi:hypothetical protein
MKPAQNPAQPGKGLCARLRTKGQIVDPHCSSLDLLGMAVNIPS